MVRHVALEGLDARIAAEFGKSCERARLERQTLRLLVCHHLQAMLDPAQEQIGVRQLIDGVRANPALREQFAAACRACARRAASAAGLRRSAAGSARKTRFRGCRRGRASRRGRRPVDLLVAAHRMYLALHRMHVGDRRVIEIFAPDEGSEFARKRRPSARSPATGRALIIAARSQFWPSVS